MKKFQSFALMMGIALTGTTLFTACTSVDTDEDRIVYDDNGQAGVKTEFVISIPRKVISFTRQGNHETQSAGSVDGFRGIDNIRLIPFASEPGSSSAKLGDIMRLSSVTALTKPGQLNYKVYSDQFVPVGTKNFLFYGRAISNNTPETEVSTMADKFKYGILNVTGLEESAEWTPNKIVFSLEQINTSTAAQANDATGKNVVDLLTSLANTSAGGKSWSTASNIVLATLYKRFTSITTSSSATLAAILSKLYHSLEAVPSSDADHALVTAIRNKITDACSTTPISGEAASLKSDYDGYPRNIGLPDGAVRVSWDSSSKSFKDVTANYGNSTLLGITEYCYPAALWYCVNTPLKAAGEKKSNSYDTAGSWDGVISSVYSGASDMVAAGTQSVALTKPAQYGVGRLETKVNMGTGTFYDANGNAVTVGSGYKLRGLLLGGQCSVGYNFEQKSTENMTIYDRDITNTIVATPGTTTSDANANQTLALETGVDQTVNAVLELENGGDEFMGADGIIPAGGTFYLAVRLIPSEADNYTSSGIKQIIKQDYVTKLTVTIKNGGTSVDRNGDGTPDKYLKDGDGNIIGIDANGDGQDDSDTYLYDINGDGTPDKFISDPEKGGPGWDTNNDGIVDLPILKDADGNYPDTPPIPDGLGNATNGIPDLTSPGVELGTSVNLVWQEGLVLSPSI